MIETLEGYLEQFRGDDVRAVSDLGLGVWHGWIPGIDAGEVLIMRRIYEEYASELLIPTQWFYRPDAHEGYFTRAWVGWREELVIWGAEPVEVESRIEYQPKAFTIEESAAQPPPSFSVVIDSATGRRVVGYNPIDKFFDYVEQAYGSQNIPGTR